MTHKLELTQREVDLMAGFLGACEGDDPEMYALFNRFSDIRQTYPGFHCRDTDDGQVPMILRDDRYN